MSKSQWLSGRELQHTTRRLLSSLVVKKGKHLSASNVGTSLIIWFVSFVGRLKQQPEREAVVLTIMRCSNWPTKSLEHAWKELRADQKWCELSTEKTVSSSKRRKFEDGSHTGSSQVKENNAGVVDDVTCRPAGVKAAKSRGKKPLVEAKELDVFKTIWEMKKEDLTRKEKLTKMKLLESLVAKQGPLPDYEEDLKIKLIKELM